MRRIGASYNTVGMYMFVPLSQKPIRTFLQKTAFKNFEVS